MTAWEIGIVALGGIVLAAALCWAAVATAHRVVRRRPIGPSRGRRRRDVR
jgi:hypothetical protein